MKRRVIRNLSLCMAVGLLIGSVGMSAFATETLDDENEEVVVEENSLVGELIFAQCDSESSINIRDAANVDAEVVGKIFNNGSAEVEAEEEEWLKITSGDVEGYAKAEFFVSGEEAQRIAEEVAYNVAIIQVDKLNVRQEPTTDSEVIATVYQDEEIEVVQYGDDWMKVALDADTFGYVDSEYVEYHTYYPTAKTLAELEGEVEEDIEEEADEEEEISDEESYDEESYEEESYEEISYAEISVTTPSVETSYETTSYDYTETEATVSETSTETTTSSATESTDDTVVTYADTTSSDGYSDYYYDANLGVYVYIDSGEITTFSSQPDVYYDEDGTAVLAETEAAVVETEAAVVETEAPVVETEAAVVETEATVAETGATVAETEAATTERGFSSSGSSSGDSSDSSIGEDIVTYASEFLGNPYSYGGTSLTDGSDCSGFVQSVYANFDIDLPRTAESQSNGGTVVDEDDLQAGDLVFYSSDGENIDHVAIYAGDGEIVHAANSDRGIVTDNADYDTIVSAVRYY